MTAIYDPVHPAMLRDNAIADRIVCTLMAVSCSVINLLPDARIDALIVIRVNGAAETVIRKGEEVIEILTLEQSDEFLIGKQDSFTLCIVDQDSGRQIEGQVA